MSEQINQRTLRNDSGRIMRALGEGARFIVTRGGLPVGELVPLRRHQFVDAAGVIEMFRAAPPVDRDRFWADLDETVDQSIDPRG